jgi:hypothetical protein
MTTSLKLMQQTCDTVCVAYIPVRVVHSTTFPPFSLSDRCFTLAYAPFLRAP